MNAVCACMFVFPRSILLGLSVRDCQVPSLELNLSSNAFGSAGAEALQSSISNISCISSLDISENGECTIFFLSYKCRVFLFQRHFKRPYLLVRFLGELPR